jgi:hypothetical protein
MKSKTINVTASGVRPTDTGASFRSVPGVDLDIVLTLPDGRVLEGEVTLLPDVSTRAKHARAATGWSGCFAAETGSSYTTWGSPDNWLDGRTWAVVRDLENWRAVLAAIGAAAINAAGSPAAKPAGERDVNELLAAQDAVTVRPAH